MTRREEIFWGVGVLLLGALAWLIFRRQLAPVIAANQNGSLDPVSLPPINIGDFVLPGLDLDSYGGFYPCECGCGNQPAGIGNFLPGLANALKGITVDGIGALSDAIGTAAHDVDAMIYFSEVPTGRVPRSIN